MVVFKTLKGKVKLVSPVPEDHPWLQPRGPGLLPPQPGMVTAGHEPPMFFPFAKPLFFFEIRLVPT